MFKAILFDMDGVIVNTEPLHYEAYKHMFDQVNVEISDDLYKTFMGKSTVEICQWICDEYKLPLAADTLVQLKRDHFKKVFDTSDKLKLIDGVFDLIKHYHDQGLTLVLASSASMLNINRIFERFDLDRYFVAKLSGADLKASKPHPEIFINAAIASGFERHECVVIEDSTNGIKAAHDAGIYCVGFNSPFADEQDFRLANTVIDSYKEIYYDKLKTLYVASK